jgi:hypothetical protein
MSAEHVEYRTGYQTFTDLSEAITAANGQQPVFRLQFGRRGVRHIERMTHGGHWMRVQSAVAQVPSTKPVRRAR